MYGLTHAKHKPSSSGRRPAKRLVRPLLICFLRAFFGANPLGNRCVDEAAPAWSSCLPGNRERPVVFKYDRVDIFDPIHALRANGATHLFLCYAFLPEGAGDEFSARKKKGRFAIDDSLHSGKPHGQFGEDDLNRDQRCHRGDAFDQRDVLRDYRRGEHRSNRDDKDEIERVELGERTFARYAQKYHERGKTDDREYDRSFDVVPALEEERRMWNYGTLHREFTRTW